MAPLKGFLSEFVDHEVIISTVDGHNYVFSEKTKTFPILPNHHSFMSEDVSSFYDHHTSCFTCFIRKEKEHDNDW